MGEFKLSPTVKKILEGRGMKLICSAPHCLRISENIKDIQKELTDKEKIDFSHNETNAIKVRGHVECPKCHHQTTYCDGVEYDEDKRIEDKNRYCTNERSLTVKCVHCGYIKAKRVWTQEVISKHIRNSHRFFHKDCWESMQYVCKDDEEEEVVASP
jgi:hypothetical protein